MPTLWSALGLAIIAIAVYVFFGDFLRNWFRYRGVRVIVCPENYQPAAVKVDAGRAARWAAFTGAADVSLRTCSRWPEKEDCDQACVRQIEESPEITALNAIVSKWFEGKRCYFCKQTIEEPGAVLAPNGGPLDWTTILPEQVPSVFAVSDPVCRRCFIVESFRAEHPDLVVERIHPSERPKTIAPTPNAIF